MVKTEEVETVGADKSSHKSLPCWSPPATSLALSRYFSSNSPDARYFPDYFRIASPTVMIIAVSPFSPR
jgi:hypothetical protein